MDTQSKPLIECPACASRLIYPLSFEPHRSGSIIVERCCPECEHSDTVVCDAPAVAAWVRRERRIRLDLVRLVLDLEVEAALTASGPASQAA